MQTQINPALAAAMTLERAAQAGQFQPMTPQGQPTVAAQLMQRAMPPAVPDVAQQAGLAAQIEAMNRQRAQNALLNQAEAASRPPAGIEGLNPQIGNFAEGGIVGRVPGYAEGTKKPIRDLSQVSEEDFEGTARDPFGSALMDILGLPINVIRNLTTHGGVSLTPFYDESVRGAGREPRRAPEDVEAARFAQDVPYGTEPPSRRLPTEEAPPQQRQAAPESRRGPSTGGLATSSAADLAEVKSGIDALAAMRLLPEPGDSVKAGIAKREAAHDFLRQTGNDPEMISKAISQYEDIYGRQLAKLTQRTAEAQERGRAGALPAFLTSFRQMRGQGIGEGFRTGAEGMEQFAGASRREIAQLEDLSMEIERAKVEKVNALKSLKYNTDMGFFNEAQKDQQRVIDAERAIQAMRIKASESAAQIRSHEAQTAAKLRSEEATRLESAAQRKLAEQDRVMLSAQGRLTEAEKARAQVAEKNKAVLALPKDAKDPMTRQMRENAEREILQAEQNVETARALYNRLLNQNLGIAGGAAQMTQGSPGFKLVSVQPAPR